MKRTENSREIFRISRIFLVMADFVCVCVHESQIALPGESMLLQCSTTHFFPFPVCSVFISSIPLAITGLLFQKVVMEFNVYARYSACIRTWDLTS